MDNTCFKDYYMLWTILIILVEAILPPVTSTGNMFKRSSQTRYLHIAGLFPVTADSVEGEIGQGVMPAVELALQHVNAHPDILPGYNLNIIWNDTQVKYNYIHLYLKMTFFY